MAAFSLETHVAIVTGGGAGIGAAIARRLAEAGAQLVLADVNLSQAQETSATIAGSWALPLEVSSPESVDEMVRTILERFGRIDILVNNAGLAGKAAPVGEQTLEDWTRIINVNMTGPFLTTRAVLPAMKRQKYGRIINIASIAGKEGNPNMSPYSATKAALIGFTKSVAKEVATENICVNAVAPAVVHTKILDQLSPEQVAYMTEKIPMRRVGRPEEIAAVVHFLASPDCSFVTGQCYDASGGRATY